MFAENLLAIGMKITEILMNESVYLDLLILDLSETVVYELWAWLCKTKIY